MNKKGLASGLLALMLVLFVVALASLFTVKIWGEFTGAINDVDNSTISPDVKADIEGLTMYINWADKIFVTLFIVLLIGYIVTSATLPVSQEVWLLFFIGFLIMATFFAMILSNTWAFMILQPDLVSALSELKAIDYVMSYFPAIVLLIGVIGAVIFYTRKSTGSGGGSAGFE